MNTATVIILTAIVSAFIGALTVIISRKKQGKGNCSCCSCSDTCPKSRKKR